MLLKILLVVTLVSAGSALAQTPLYDPEQLPSFRGTVEAYLVSPRDELEGFFLDDGTEVHVASRLSAELAYSVKPGDRVTIHGLRATGHQMIQALAVANDATGAKVSDTFVPGWPAPQRNPEIAPRYMEARGRIKRLTHGADGEVNGVMLDDNTLIRFGDRLMPQYPDCLVPGRDVAATGTGLAGALGKVLETRSISLVPAVPDSPASPQSRCALVPVRPPEKAERKLPLLNPSAGSGPR